MPQSDKMNIYEKLGRIQDELLSTPISKSGHNKFGGFDYYELEDLEPPIIKLCVKYRCTHYFNFDEENGTLILKDWDSENLIAITVPFEDVEKLPKMNMAQSSGTYQTYMKRYLLLHMFLVCEGEIIDATEHGNDGGENVSIVKKTVPPKIVQKLIEKCKNEFPDKECNKKMLNQVSFKMLKNNEISKQDRKTILEWINAHEDEIISS